MCTTGIVFPVGLTRQAPVLIEIRVSSTNGAHMTQMTQHTVQFLEVQKSPYLKDHTHNGQPINPMTAKLPAGVLNPFFITP